MIPDNFTDAYAQVKNLVQRFNANEKEYLSADYQEANVRQEFLDKFFVALGWDVYHERQTNPYQREVRIEKSIKVEGRGKRADYAFFLAPNFQQTRFIAEAKKPIHNLENRDYCFQALRYGWNSNTPLAILTDFDRLFILDSRYKPSIETAVSRIYKRFRYTDFADEEKFRELYFLFSRQAVADDSIEKYVADFLKGAKKKGKQIVSTQVQPVDEVFLKELDEQREKLAKSFKNRNPNLDGEELTEIIQRTLDRLVFIRFLEDKLVEANELINSFGAKSNSAWQDFTNESVRLNKIYNGIIFKPHSILDKPNFAPDERAFEDTRDWISARNSAYDFNTIPIHILGSIYERFLGKTIVATDKRARIEEKPEVRKAGGVYYTPEYIVRYIVENTIGKLIENKKPEEIAEMRFADIACGSGSFLLGVFDFLIQYHVKYFSENKTRRDKAIKEGIARENADGVLQLTIPYKKEILLNNIYGVDLDAQAVEVAQLSLYLKLLEEETTHTAQLLTGLREQLLPSLDKNIVFGNSLIDEDIMEGMLFDFKDLKRIKPMNFARTFPKVFKDGGFDAIVGNPPYGASLTEITRQYLKKNFNIGTTDTAALMMIQAINITKEKARIGFIVPKSFAYSSTWEKTRKLLIKELEILIDAGKVWKNVKLEQVICIFSKGTSNNSKYDSLKRNDENFEFLAEISKSEVDKFGFYLNGLNDEEISIGRKLYEVNTFLGELVDNSRGGMFQKDVSQVEMDIKVVGGKQVNQLFIVGQKGFIENKQFLPSNSFVSPNDILVQNIVAHIMNPIEHIKIIGAVVNEQMSSNIVILDTVNRLENKSNLSSYYILALLHSKLINWYVYRFIYAKAVRTMHFDKPVSDKIPIRTIDFDNPKEKEAHDKIVKLAANMLEAKRKLAAEKTDTNKRIYQRLCDSLDAQIDETVYQLYDLTDEEIEIVEGKA
ncbi:hypothetical protein BH20ACI1_BH20ACI1_27720 [soil metagenome]